MRLNLEKVANGWILTPTRPNTASIDVYVFQSLWDLHTHLQEIERQQANQSVIPSEDVAF